MTGAIFLIKYLCTFTLIHMTKKDYYSTLWVQKTASEAEIKKAYKKLAMQYHPDRNKGDKKAEEKFKEVNEAYQMLGDTAKRKNYDQFWNADFSWSWVGGNPFWGGFSWQSWGFGGFEDIFSQFWWSRKSSSGFEFDIWDIFGNMWWTARENTRQRKNEEKVTTQEENLDVTETVEIPFLDFLFEKSLDIRTVYGKHLTLKVKAGTKPGTKFKISGKWRTSGGKTGDMYVVVDAKMPKIPLDSHVEKMIEAIRYQL